MNQDPDETGGYGGAGGCFGSPFWNDVAVGGAMAVARSRQDPSDPFGRQVSSGAGFTVAQREELHRQSVIYKYMVASVPVPPELLIPKPSTPNPKSISGSPSPSTRANSSKGSVELDLWGNKDSEPWRCRRTDGKKWRCGRDAAPDQKYCERHTHKSRNARSRKHVELHADFISTPYQKPCSVQSQSQSQRGRGGGGGDQLCSFPSSYDQSRCLEWFINGETNTNHNIVAQQQQHDFGLGNDQQHTRLFIDAWPEVTSQKSSGSSNQKLPFSCLTLSTSGGDCSEESSVELRPNWMSPVSWMNSPPGGPLAEALCLGIAGAPTSTGKSSVGDGGQGITFIN